MCRCIQCTRKLLRQLCIHDVHVHVYVYACVCVVFSCAAISRSMYMIYMYMCMYMYNVANQKNLMFARDNNIILCTILQAALSFLPR